MIVSLLGASGHMGIATLKEFLQIKEIDLIKVLLVPQSKHNKRVKKIIKKHREKVKVIYGDIALAEDVNIMVKNCDYLFNLAAIIPPLSDKYPHKSYLVNELGTYNLVQALEMSPKTKLIDITSVALYGNRNHLHPFARVGDPIIPSVYDVYAAGKMRSEYKILESNINNFVIIRQTAMIYEEMLISNMHDGLMFHTPFNAPLEWSTAEDSARLMANIIKEDLLGHLNMDNFWNKVFNLGAPNDNRITGFETFEGGFRLIGGTCKKFFSLNDNVIRNFHGAFYFDGDTLNKLFHYQKDKIADYWQRIKKKYAYFSLAKLITPKTLRNFIIKKLYKDPNAPKYWYQNNDIPRLTAFFGGKEKYESLSPSWNDFKAWDYLNERDNDKYLPIDYGFDINKSDQDITIDDLRNVALMHGGRLISNEFKKGDIYQKLVWENLDKVKFTARPYTILRAGHWYNPLYKSYIWDFDRIAKKDKIIAQYWYDSHSQDENNCYYMDENFKALIK